MHTTLRFLFASLLLGCFFTLGFADEANDTRILRLFVNEFVELTPGKGKFPASFVMGSTDKDAPASEKPAHTILLKSSFAMAKYEVTQELYQLVMGKNPSRWKGPRNSVEMISWDDANTFCSKVTELLRKRKMIGEKDVIRLPSESEWEYSCRAGTKTRFSFGDKAEDLGPYAWFKGNSKGEDPPVGKKKPNPWGLYDMHGYIWEWCADAWNGDLKKTPSDGRPFVSKEENRRVIRGGSWADPADAARSAYRTSEPRKQLSDRIGFRCVKVTVGN